MMQWDDGRSNDGSFHSIILRLQTTKTFVFAKSWIMRLKWEQKSMGDYQTRFKGVISVDCPETTHPWQLLQKSTRLSQWSREVQNCLSFRKCDHRTRNDRSRQERREMPGWILEQDINGLESLLWIQRIWRRIRRPNSWIWTAPGIGACKVRHSVSSHAALCGLFQGRCWTLKRPSAQ